MLVGRSVVLVPPSWVDPCYSRGSVAVSPVLTNRAKSVYEVVGHQILVSVQRNEMVDVTRA